VANKKLPKLWYLIFKKTLSRAKTLVKDRKKLQTVIEHSFQKTEKHSKALSEFLEDLKLLIRLIKAWIAGEYTDVSVETIALLVGAILYFLMPFDAIPDFVPVVGFVDDAAVLAWVLVNAKNEIDKFRKWESGDSG